jgi:hypothetical protein
MHNYRCYFLDARNYIRVAENIEAETPGEAIDRSLALLREHPKDYSVELWQGEQRVYPLPRVR